jgi:hypothetical protein
MHSIPFDTYSTTYDNYLREPHNFGAGELMLRGLEPLPFYEKMFQLLDQQDAEARYLHEGGWYNERSWYASMAPEYKIHPEAVGLLASTQIDIDAKYLKLPYDAFSTRFPKHFYREHDKAPYLKGLRELPKRGFRYMEPKQCLGNSQEVALRNEKAIYVEGVVTSVIGAIKHARGFARRNTNSST